jgi:two-component system, NtrC family, sensor kinase
MRLARKLTLLVLLGTAFVLALYAYVSARREIELLDQDMLSDHRTLGRALANAASAVWRVDGQARAQWLVSSSNSDGSSVSERLVWLPPDAGPSASSGLSAHQVAQLLSGNEVVTLRKAATGPSELRTYFPVEAVGGRHAAVELAESLEYRNAYVKTSVETLAVAALIIIALSSVLTAVFGITLVGRPVRSLVEQARRIGAGDLKHHLEAVADDELGELGTEMNAMCDRLDDANTRIAAEAASRIAALQQLRHADRLKTVGKLASGIAHELGTPLNVVSGRAKMIARGQVTGDAVLDNARIIAEQTDRMTGIIRQVLDFARQREPHKAPTDPRQLAGQIASLLAPLASKKGVTIELLDGDPVGPVALDASQLQQVLTNLVMNAVQAMPGRGAVRLEVELEERQAPEEAGGGQGVFVRFTVADQGPGIDPSVVERIFEPFFTTKEVGEGTGLGLSVAYGIVRDHGGWMEVDSKLGIGTRFSVYVPMRQS